MEAKITYDERGFIRIRVVGSASRADLLALMDEFRSHPRYDGSRLWDLREGTIVAIDSDDMASLMDRAESTDDLTVASRVAVVVGRDVDFGVARMLQLSQGLRMGAVCMEVFHNLDDAERWMVATQNESG